MPGGKSPDSVKAGRDMIDVAVTAKTIAADPAFHIHLEPIEKYRALVRSRVFPQPPK